VGRCKLSGLISWYFTGIYLERLKKIINNTPGALVEIQKQKIPNESQGESICFLVTMGWVRNTVIIEN